MSDVGRVIPEPDALLGPDGDRMWRRLWGDYDFNEAEREIVFAACRTRDDIAEMEAFLVDAPMTVLGSAKQVTSHPVRVECRQARMTLTQFLRQLKLPDLEDVADGSDSPASSAARQLNATRWGNKPWRSANG